MSKMLLLGEDLGNGCFVCLVEEPQEFSTELRWCGFESSFVFYSGLSQGLHFVLCSNSLFHETVVGSS